MQWFIYAIIYKLADDFDDEEVYNIYFPNGKYICYTILIFYTIYLFYFKDITSCIYFNLFILELGYIFFLLVKYLNYSNIIIIGEIKLSLYDPFTLKSTLDEMAITGRFFTE